MLLSAPALLHTAPVPSLAITSRSLFPLMALPVAHRHRGSRGPLPPLPGPPQMAPYPPPMLGAAGGGVLFTTSSSRWPKFAL